MLMAGSPVSIDSLLDPDIAPHAILISHLPGQSGALATAHAMFGVGTADFGKLPYTVYPRGYQEEIAFTDMSFRTPPGRTHR